MEISNLDHLGLVAGTIDELEIEKIINRKLGESKCEKSECGKSGESDADEWTLDSSDTLYTCIVNSLKENP